MMQFDCDDLSAFLDSEAPAAPAVGRTEFVVPPIPEPARLSEFVPQDASQQEDDWNLGGDKGKKAEKGSLTKEESNALGIIVHGQSMDDFMLTQSDMYIVRKENKALKKSILIGVEPDSPNYGNMMREYRKQAVAKAMDVFRTSKKLPDCYVQGREWMDTLGDGEDQMHQFFNESQTYGVSAFDNMILRTRDRFEAMFGFGLWMETGLFLDVSFTTATAMFHDLTANVLLAGGHSGGKSYLVRAIGSTQAPGVWDPINQMSAKLLNMSGPDDCRARTFDELTGQQVGAEISKNNNESDSALKSVMTDPCMISKIANHNSDSKERRGLRYVGTNYGAWFGCYDGKIPPANAPLFNRWIYCPIEHIDSTHDESIVNRMNQIKDPGLADVNADLLHAQKLRNFYIAIVNYLIWCKALPEVNMDAFRAYFNLYEASMNEHGFALADSKKYGQLSIIARAYTVMHAVTMAFASDITLELRSRGRTGYKNFWEVLPDLIEYVVCHLVCTREIAAWTFSISRMLWGNPVSTRVVHTLYRNKVMPFLDHFDVSCFESSELAETMRKDAASSSRRKGVTAEDLGDHEGDEELEAEALKYAETMAQRVEDRMALLEQDPDLAAELAIREDMDSANAEFHRCLELAKASAASEASLDRRANERTTRRAINISLDEHVSVRSDAESDTGGAADEEDDEMTSRTQKRQRRVPVSSSENSMSAQFENGSSNFTAQPLENLIQTPVQKLSEKMTLETTYESNLIKVDPNYIEICTEDHTMESVAFYIRSNSGAQKPSTENIRAALKAMESQYVAVPLLEFAIDEKNVAHIVKKVDPKTHKAVTRKMALVRVIRNQKIHDKQGLVMPGFRVYVLTQFLLRQTTLISSVKRSIQALGFLHTMPTRVMISTPKYITSLGKDGNGFRESTTRLFDMVRIKPIDKPFIIRNVDPISTGTRESFARLYNGSHNASKRWKPLITSQAETIYVNVEPEVIAASLHCKMNGVTGVFADLAYPAVLEVELAQLRLTKLRDHTVEAYPQVREAAVISMNRARVLGRSGAATLNKDNMTTMADIMGGCSISAKALAVMKKVGPQHVHQILNKPDGSLRPLANAGEVSEEAQLARLRSSFIEHSHPLGAQGRRFVVGDPTSAVEVVYSSRIRRDAQKKRAAKRSDSEFVPFRNANMDEDLAPAVPRFASDFADERSMSSMYRPQEPDEPSPIDEDLPDINEALLRRSRMAPELESERTLDEFKSLRDKNEGVQQALRAHSSKRLREETGAFDDGTGGNTAQVVGHNRPAVEEVSSAPKNAVEELMRIQRSLNKTR